MSNFIYPIATPRDLGIEKRTIIPPENGWQEQNYYLVDAAFSDCNIIARYIFHSGFLAGESNEPAGYNEFGFTEDYLRYGNAFYLKVIDKIDMQNEP